MFDENLEIMLEAYKPEFIFSEKLEAITKLGSMTSRMKDFYDLYIMIENNILDKKQVLNAVETTFKNRKTAVEIPLAFTETDITKLQKMWFEYIKSKNVRKPDASIPNEINNIIDIINTYLN